MNLNKESWKKRKGLGSIFLCCLLAPCLSFGQSSLDDAYESANNDFSEGEFIQAAEKYETIVQEGHFSKNLFFNLGTAFYRTDSFGKGALWFRRAQLLDPSTPEIHQNMEFLRGKLGLLEFTSSKPERFLLSISPALLRWLSALGFWIGAFMIVTILFVRRMDRFRALVISGLVCGIVLAGTSIWAGIYRDQNLAPENFATITSPDTKAVTAPTPDAKSVIDLPPGSEIKILQKANHWTYAEIPGNLRGWIRSENLEPVWPIPAPKNLSSALYLK